MSLESDRFDSPASFARRALIGTATFLVLAALLFLVWEGLDVLLLLFAGLLFGLFLTAITEWLREHTPLPRSVALACVLLALFGLLALAFWMAGPSISREADELQKRLPEAVEGVRQRLDRHELGRRLLDEMPGGGEAVSGRGAAISRATGVLSGVLDSVGNAFIILLFGIFVAAEPGTYLDGIVRLVAPSRRDHVRAALVDAGAAVKRWLLSKVLRMLFIGVASWIALTVLGVPIAFLLALIAALLTFVPNFGPIVAAVPAVLLALLQGPSTALWVVALYVAIQVVEGNVLDPLLTKTIVAVPPALTFGVQVFLGVLAGPVGLAVATPLTAAGVVLIQRLYVEDVLEGTGRAVAAPAPVGETHQA